MDEVKQLDPETLTEGIIIWTGWGRNAWPVRDDSLVADHFGKEVAPELLKTIHEMEDEFYTSGARFVADDLVTMAEMAADEFRSKHPEIGEEAIKALAWCYTYDYK